VFKRGEALLFFPLPPSFGKGRGIKGDGLIKDDVYRELTSRYNIYICFLEKERTC
jgi:hypothetical protein